MFLFNILSVITPPHTTKTKQRKPTQPHTKRNQLQDHQAKPHNPQSPRHTTHAKELQEKTQNRGTRLKQIKAPEFFCAEFLGGVPQRNVYVEGLKIFFLIECWKW